jgi:hypothetical protein
MELTIRMVKKCGSGGGQSMQLSNGTPGKFHSPVRGEIFVVNKANFTKAP